MPELPEVETVRRGIAPYVAGQRIEHVEVREARLRWPVEPALPGQLQGRRVLAAERRGKYLLLPLDDGARLLIHLGMSGRLLVVPPQTPVRPHDHVDLLLGNGWLLRYFDPRRFGAILLWPADQAVHPLLAGMGPEPFAPGFDGDYLYARSRGRSAAVKSFVMDARTVAGAGNIYATEALFRAGLRPGKPAGRISRPQYRKLAQNIRDVLQEAIAEGGTTLRDFAGADGRAGYFQQALYAYGREGRPCRICNSTIRCERIGQRSSFFCPRCQR